MARAGTEGEGGGWKGMVSVGGGTQAGRTSGHVDEVEQVKDVAEERVRH